MFQSWKDLEGGGGAGGEDLLAPSLCSAPISDAELFYLPCGENGFAHGPDVPRAVRFRGLQPGEGGHGIAGEVAEGGLGGLDGVLEHLGGDTRSADADSCSVVRVFKVIARSANLNQFSETADA